MRMQHAYAYLKMWDLVMIVSVLIISLGLVEVTIDFSRIDASILTDEHHNFEYNLK